jgi:hypothetical protein
VEGLMLHYMKDGTYRWHLVRATPSSDASGSLSRWYGTMMDIEQVKTHHETREQMTEKWNRLRDESQANSPSSLSLQTKREEIY